MNKYAVIFKTYRDLPVPQEYLDINKELQKLVTDIEGFLGVESVGDENGYGLSISYWNSLEAIKEWKSKALHLEAQRMGSEKFYKFFKVEICEILTEYSGGFDKPKNKKFS